MKKSKKKFEISLESYGRYTCWNNKNKALPKIIEFTSEIEAVEGNEFGMILNIRKGKGITLQFIISHPPILDDHGKIIPDFTGEYKVTSNNFHFFIGEGLWTPLEEKAGKWKITVLYNDLLLAKKEFNIYFVK